MEAPHFVECGVEAGGGEHGIVTRDHDLCRAIEVTMITPDYGRENTSTGWGVLAIIKYVKGCRKEEKCKVLGLTLRR